MEGRPCCAAAVACKIEHIQIGDSDIGFNSLYDIMNDAKEMNLPDESYIGNALLNRIKNFNIISSNLKKRMPDWVIERM